jgi:hypothetical protein
MLPRSGAAAGSAPPRLRNPSDKHAKVEWVRRHRTVIPVQVVGEVVLVDPGLRPKLMYLSCHLRTRGAHLANSCALHHVTRQPPIHRSCDFHPPNSSLPREVAHESAFSVLPRSHSANHRLCRGIQTTPFGPFVSARSQWHGSDSDRRRRGHARRTPPRVPGRP